MSEIKAARASEIKDGELRTVDLPGGKRAVLTRAGGRWFAFEDRCSHDDGDLSGASLTGEGEVECPRHGGRFDLATGRATQMPAIAPIETYEVHEKNGDIWLNIKEEAA